MRTLRAGEVVENSGGDSWGVFWILTWCGHLLLNISCPSQKKREVKYAQDKLQDTSTLGAVS